jgi:HD superfamily phosphohydrolase
MIPATFGKESLISDPLYGYLTFTAVRAGEVGEQSVVDHPWVQRLRQIHQLQNVCWVYPSAEHTRFQHVLGAMHLAGRAAAHLYDSLRTACGGQLPSHPYVESLVRLAALLHDVGHGPFGHFFDDHYLHRFGLTHEDIGQHIIRTELAELIRGVRENPHGRLDAHETLQPEQVAFLIKRPAEGTATAPAWLRLLRALFGGVYTVDNMDFVLRDCYMSGHSPRAFDLDRLLHYSFFTDAGLTLHARGLDTLIHFLEARSELFRTLYFHRTVRAMDLMLWDVFGPTLELLLPGPPLENLDAYRRLTEWSLMVDVARWPADPDPRKRLLGEAWRAILERRVPWKMACERLIRFEAGQAELTSIFTDAELVERRVRAQLPVELADLPFRADVARHSHRPSSSEAARQNAIYEPATGTIRPLVDHERFARLPVSFALCRLYALDHSHDADLAKALDRLLRTTGDDKTNM